MTRREKTLDLKERNMNNDLTYKFSNEKEFQEEIERCCENNRNTFHERDSWMCRYSLFRLFDKTIRL